MRRVHTVLLALQLTAAISAKSTTLDAETVRLAAAEAARIWKPHVELGFVEADRATGPFDITVIFTDVLLPATEGDVSGIGQIRFSRPGVPMNTIYLSVSGARRLAAQARWRDVPLQQMPPRMKVRFLVHTLGRALAHEIGHFLLRSTAHASRGLMRERFLAAELLEASLVPYSLTAAQAAAVRREREAALLASSMK